MNIILWMITGCSTTGFLVLWFATVYRELSNKKQCLMDLANQAKMHKDLYDNENHGPHKFYALRMFETSQMLLFEAVKEYEAIRNKPMNRIPGFIMGFRRITEQTA